MLIKSFQPSVAFHAETSHSICSATFLYPLKTSENQRFSDVFMGYRNVTLQSKWRLSIWNATLGWNRLRIINAPFAPLIFVRILIWIFFEMEMITFDESPMLYRACAETLSPSYLPNCYRFHLHVLDRIVYIIPPMS